MEDDFLIFGSPAIGEEEIEEMVKTLRSGWLGTGPRVRRFEKMFCEYTGARHSIALNSCSSALHLSLVVSGIGEGDEVITTPMTFCATTHAILHSGARPVFVDVDRRTGNIDPDQIERAITPKTRALLPVHYAGRPCLMDAIQDIAHRHELKVIEDAAHCVEGVSGGRKVGSISDFTCFSFYVTKNVVTGEGGMLTTDSEEQAAEARVLSLHGISRDAWKRYSSSGFKHYQVVRAGYKYNMTDMQAALGIHQLARVGTNHERRGEVWEAYNAGLSDLPLILPPDPRSGDVHGFHLYTILVDDQRTEFTRDEVMAGLHEAGIGTGVHFQAVHLEPLFADLLGHRPGDFPNAEYIADRTLSVPFSAKLTDEDVKGVINALHQVFSAA